ncbi:MAG: type III pantothenate kinase [Colwellia sp.]
MLLVDIGNSKTKYTYFENEQFSTVVSVANEQFNVDVFKLEAKAITKVLVANVANQDIAKKIEQYCKGVTNSKGSAIDFLEIKSEKQRGAVVSGYEQPERLGVDRWLAILGGQALYPNQTLLIIDSGTATTVDLLNDDGTHFGGWIMPGIDTLFTSVLSSTKKVNADYQATASMAFGTNTDANVNNACWAMTVGAIKEALVEANKLVTQVDKVILTGGNAEKISTLVQNMQEKPIIESELLFHGMKSYL